MSSATIRSAFSMWPQYRQRLRDVVAAITGEQLADLPQVDLWDPGLG